jgi:hypothetical protein
MALQPPHVASRLVMAGVDLRTVQVLGGWRTLAMVQRYSHLAPANLQDAVERLVPKSSLTWEFGHDLDRDDLTHATVS